MEFVKENWLLILILYGLPFAVEVVVRLTPTKKDDSIFDAIKKVLDKYVPNLRKGGGKH